MGSAALCGGVQEAPIALVLPWGCQMQRSRGMGGPAEAGWAPCMCHALICRLLDTPVLVVDPLCLLSACLWYLLRNAWERSCCMQQLAPTHAAGNAGGGGRAEAGAGPRRSAPHSPCSVFAAAHEKWSTAGMSTFRRALPAALLALLAVGAAGQGAANSTEGVIAYVSRSGWRVGQEWRRRHCRARRSYGSLQRFNPAAFHPAKQHTRAHPPSNRPQNGLGTGYTQVIINPSSGYGGAPLALRIQLEASTAAAGLSTRLLERDRVAAIVAQRLLAAFTACCHRCHWQAGPAAPCCRAPCHAVPSSLPAAHCGCPAAPPHLPACPAVQQQRGRRPRPGEQQGSAFLHLMHGWPVCSAVPSNYSEALQHPLLPSPTQYCNFPRVQGSPQWDSRERLLRRGPRVRRGWAGGGGRAARDIP